MISQPLVSEISHLEASLCYALADPTRILMLYALSEKPHNVTELSTALSLSQPATSRHLKILREQGLAKTERMGTTIVYSLTDPRIIGALNLLRAVLTDHLLQKTALVAAMAQL